MAKKMANPAGTSSKSGSSTANVHTSRIAGLRLNRRLKWGLALGAFFPLGGLAIALNLPALALSTSVDRDGIDALRLHESPYNLTGKKIAIGQVEIGRPSQFGIDKLAVENSPFQVGRIFELDGPAIADQAVDGHASNVASVMVSNDKTLRGVAPDAFLYAAAIGNLTEFTGQKEECIATQHVALQN
ncbi:MAG: hypothetical protein AAFU53_21000, partial [Cyanobacteria bacterium J06632_3]